MRQQQDWLDQHHTDVKVVTFDDDFMAQAYIEETQLEWPLLLDSNRKVYRSYCMGRGSWWDLYNPLSILRYLKLMIGGRQPGQPGNDWHQLGGDVVIDPAGIVRLHYTSTDPHDRPTVEKIFQLIEKSI